MKCECPIHWSRFRFRCSTHLELSGAGLRESGQYRFIHDRRGDFFESRPVAAGRF